MQQDTPDLVEAQRARRRLIYVTERIKVIADELIALKAERDLLKAATPVKDAGT